MKFELLPEKEIKIEPTRPGQKMEERIGEAVKETARPIARTAKNLTSLGLGLTGDVAKLVNDWVAGPIAGALTGKETIPYEETFLNKVLPTTQQNKQTIESLNPEYLKPRGPAEEFFDDVVEDTALLWTPASKTKLPYAKSASSAQKLFKSFGVSLGSNLAGEGVKDWTGSEEKGSYAKIGTMFLLSVMDRKKAGQYISELYEEAKNLLPNGAKQNAQSLENTLLGLQQKVSKGTLAPSEKFVFDEAKLVLDKIKNGEITVEEAWASKRSLNEKLESHLYENKDKKARARARKLSSEINRGLDKTIEDYGKSNPDFYKKYKDAQEGFGTIAQSNFLTRALEKYVKFSPTTNGLMHVFGGALASGATAALGGGLNTTIATGVAYPTIKLLYRIFKSPTLKKHYLNVTKAAVAEDAALLNKELQNLDKGLQKEEKKDRFELID